MQQSDDPDGAVKLALCGELDLDALEAFVERLHELKLDRADVRLDVSRLTFLDLTGLHAIIDCVAEARRDGWNLQIGRQLTAPVRRVIDLADAGSLLWPDS